MTSSAQSHDVFIGSLDQGTTSTRFIIYDREGKAIASHHVEFTQFYPEAGWVEHDPLEILESVKVCTAKALDKATANGYNVDRGLKAIGITNQRETTVIWSKSTGLPLYNAIVWMDVRTSHICRRLENDLPGGKTHFVETCGLPISTYFSATKILWLIENVDGINEAIQAGDALFGTIDSWVIWNLTGGTGSANCEEKPVQGIHITDCSNASRTMLMNLKTLDWDQPTLEALGVPSKILPKIVSNSEIIGVIANGWPLSGVPIAGCLGDQHSAMLGQLCQKGQAKSTYGTGAFILLNTGEEIVQSSHGLLSTLAYKLGPNAPPNYALEGSIAIAGAAVQWLRDGLGIIQTASEIEELAEMVENTGGVYFVPAFNGLFAPWWRDDARGVCVGITRFTNRAHIARAVLESMCFQVNDVLDSMHKDFSKGAESNSKGEFLLRVDGGATVNNLLMQIQEELKRTRGSKPVAVVACVLYWLWVNRNHKLHNGNVLPPNHIIANCFQSIEKPLDQSSSEPWDPFASVGVVNPKLIGWVPSPQGWLKVKVDGSPRGIGAVGWDWNGNYIALSYQPDSYGYPLLAEKMAFKLGTDIGATLAGRFLGIWIQSDSTQVVDLIQRAMTKEKGCDIVTIALWSVAAYTMLIVSHISWESNKEAHFCANYGGKQCIFWTFLDYSRPQLLCEMAHRFPS